MKSFPHHWGNSWLFGESNKNNASPAMGESQLKMLTRQNRQSRKTRQIWQTTKTRQTRWLAKLDELDKLNRLEDLFLIYKLAVNILDELE